MENLTISMAMLNSYVSLPEGNPSRQYYICTVPRSAVIFGARGDCHRGTMGTSLSSLPWSMVYVFNPFPLILNTPLETMV